MGREHELRELGELLEHERLLSMVGPGGAGKTRLARELTGGRPERTAVVELATVADTVDDEVAAAVFGRRLSTPPTVERIAAELGDEPALLVLDNCEHLVAPVARVAHALLDGIPRLRVLVTSRRALGASDELVWQIPPLTEDDSRRLFVERAARRDRSAVASPADEIHVQRICAELEGQPLAIELAAARTAVLTVAEIADALGDRLRLLASAPPTRPARHRTLRASLDWSHDLLDEDAQVLFRRLGVFAGGWTLAGAEAVAAAPDLPRERVLDALAALVEGSIAQAHRGAEGMRFSMLATVREYALERLEEAGETRALRDRHLDHHVRIAARQARARLDPAVQEAGLRESANFAEALEHALEHAPDQAMSLVAPLAELWLAAGGYATPAEYMRRALAAAPHHPRHAEVTAALSFVQYYRGDYVTAARTAESVLEREDAGATPDARARSLVTTALVTGMTATADGHTQLDEALPLLDASRRPEVALDAAWLRALMFGLADDHERATTALDAWWALLEGEHATWWHCRYFYNRSWTSSATGREEETREDLLRALQAHERIGATGVDAFCLGDLALVDIRSGALDAAERQLEIARHAAERSGNVLAGHRKQFKVGCLRLAQGDPVAARREVRVPLAAEGTATNVSYGLGGIMALSGFAAAAVDELETAREEARVCETVALRLGDNPWFRASAELIRGLCALREGDPGAGRERLQSGLAIAWAAGLVPLVEDLLDHLAAALAMSGKPVDAARILGGADGSRRRAGRVAFMLQPPERAVLAKPLADPAIAAIRQEAAEAPLPEVVGYARRARGARERPLAGWASLTPAEARVAELAAGGLTNAKIGAQLFMSPHTVKVHLSHIYGKLGVAGRTQLAALRVAEPGSSDDRVG